MIISNIHLLNDVKSTVCVYVPLFSVAELLMSPVINEDSVCFLTVSFHIRRIRLCEEHHTQNITQEHSAHV